MGAAVSEAQGGFYSICFAVSCLQGLGVIPCLCAKVPSAAEQQQLQQQLTMVARSINSSSAALPSLATGTSGPPWGSSLSGGGSRALPAAGQSAPLTRPQTGRRPVLMCCCGERSLRGGKGSLFVAGLTRSGMHPVKAGLKKSCGIRSQLYHRTSISSEHCCSYASSTCVDTVSREVVAHSTRRHSDRSCGRL